MSLDLSRINVPFRMQPGLQRLADGTPQLTPLAAGSALWADKKRVLESGASRLAVPGFDQRPVVAAILARGLAEGHAVEAPLELAFEEDFALLDGPSTTLPWLCVCVPSHWAPEAKLGLPFTAVHAPVADNQLLLAAAAQLVRLVTDGGSWERWVWTVTPSCRHDQHPARQARTPWPAEPAPMAFAGQCFLRSERQTFFPLAPGSSQAVFTIRVQLEPLAAAIRSRTDARRLHDALASMSDAVLAYKGLQPARARLLAWLAMRAA
ncbi:MAG: hypothetical protein JWP65_526 [Ramlibacter sp.]|jgi:hypothetical protein|uniref:heme-dependent oxidative N-demethylase subunit alpha family protein n=1 Tax=Ramlibacter sp. TaxID=1917967 RepID=UPI00262C5AB2|nr:heme-dependent oxidative N-demethylase subunit alpha family protein [Ramlibacter sp.]MDB5750105.1 hypothetical protein [Ramlibacter sp.]